MADWATERARAVVNSIGYIEDPEAAIAAALQQVADECAALANERIVDYVGTLAEYTCAKVRNDIRARFPQEGA